MTYADLAVVVTALRRPQYFRQTLDSWRAARHLDEVHSFTIALGDPGGEKFVPMLNVVTQFREATRFDGKRAPLRPDSSAAIRSRGMGRAIGEAANHVLADPAVQFVVFGEEDIVVSSDVLEYMGWAREAFADDERVLAVCAHSVGGQGWDEPGIGLTTADADQETVQLLPYFNPWVWGTWRDRWEQALRPQWDWEVNSGGPVDSGYDWNLHRRIIPQGGYVCVVPDASRSQNIGKDGGWAASPGMFESTQAASFRAERPPVAYRVGETREQAA